MSDLSKAAAVAAATMWKLVHGNPRRNLNRLTPAQLKEADKVAQRIVAKESDPRYASARAASKSVQYNPRQLSDHTGNDLAKRLEDNPRDPVLAICDLHKRGGHPVIAPASAPNMSDVGPMTKGVLDPRIVKVMKDRFERDKVKE